MAERGDQHPFMDQVTRLARLLAEDRRAVLTFARSAPAPFWSRASVVEGWSHRDILAHIGGGDDQVLQHLLRAVTERRPIPPELLQPDTDAENARAVAERRSWPLSAVLEELEAGGREIQELLAQLEEADGALPLPATPLTLAGFLPIVAEERHDREHLAQLKAGTRAAG